MDKSLFMSVGETAEYLGMPKSRVYTLVSGRNFPAVRMGKSWYINREQLPAWASKVCK